MTPEQPPSGHAPAPTPAPEGDTARETPTEALRRPALRPGLAWCRPCIDEHHHPAPRWHSWASDDDAMTAIARRLPDPRRVRCGCPCADGPPPGTAGRSVVETVHLPEEDQT